MICIAMAIAFISCSKKEELIDKEIAKVNSYYPNSGKAGTLVTIEGEGFSSSITEFTATVAGNSAEVISATPTAVVLRVPKGDKSGTVVLKYGNNSFDVGTYTYQALQVVRAGDGAGTVGHASQAVVGVAQAVNAHVLQLLIEVFAQIAVHSSEGLLGVVEEPRHVHDAESGIIGD